MNVHSVIALCLLFSIVDHSICCHCELVAQQKMRQALLTDSDHSWSDLSDSDYSDGYGDLKYNYSDDNCSQLDVHAQGTPWVLQSRQDHSHDVHAFLMSRLALIADMTLCDPLIYKEDLTTLSSSENACV